MTSKVYSITSPLLKPHIQYILFNQNSSGLETNVKCYPNTNICLGISRGYGLVQKGNTFSSVTKHDQLFAYTTGLYNTPRNFQVSAWDEICIDFHPLGYFHFFKIPSRPEIMDDAFAMELFNPEELQQLHLVFETLDLDTRGLLLERLLISRLQSYQNDTLQLALHYIHQAQAKITVKDLMVYTQCSERKLYKLFTGHFGITPKQYIRVLKMRTAMDAITDNPQISLTQIAYSCGYYDQSHFIKEAKLMCELLPKEMSSTFISIDNEVIVSL